MFLSVTQWWSPLCPLANPFCGFCCLGSCPFVCLVCCFSWRNANLAGGFAGRLGCVSCVLFGVIWFACIYGPSVSLYKCRLDSLCSCKDRATVRHRPYPRRKKKFLFGVFCLLVTVHMEFFYSSRLQDWVHVGTNQALWEPRECSDFFALLEGAAQSHAISSVVLVGCCVSFCVGGFVFGWCFVLFGGDFVTVYWTALRSCTSSLLRPLNQRTAMCMR